MMPDAGRLKDKLNRVGVIDIGSNSVRLVVFDGATRSPAYFFNEKLMCGLGIGLVDTGKLNPEGRERALQAMIRFKSLSSTMELESLTAVATAAVRDALDGPDFCEDVMRLTGISINVASGLDEARLSAQGVLLGWPTAHGLVCDIGGASMELAELNSGSVAHCQTSTLGPLRLADLALEPKQQTKFIKEEIDTLRRQLDGDYDHLFLVGGSYRAIAKIDMKLRDYPLDVLHEYKITASQLLDTLDKIDESSLDDLKKLSNSSMTRLQLVPLAARVLRQLIETFEPRVLAISSYGLREGLLYDQMSQELRDKDPLIEACKAQELNAARFPGFGVHLSEWVLQIVPEADAELKRLILAISLLHDVSWRAHPNFRADVSFDSATRSNLGGLNHTGRVFAAIALFHRYKAMGAKKRYENLFALLTENELQQAKIVGRALRLGAIMAGGSPRILGAVRLHLEPEALRVRVQASATDVIGETVHARLISLASALEVELIIEKQD